MSLPIKKGRNERETNRKCIVSAFVINSHLRLLRACADGWSTVAGRDSSGLSRRCAETVCGSASRRGPNYSLPQRAQGLTVGTVQTGRRACFESKRQFCARRCHWFPVCRAKSPGSGLMGRAPLLRTRHQIRSIWTVTTFGREKFVQRVITDTEHEGMRAATIHIPEKWHFESKIEWHYNWVEYPLSYSAHAENPDNAEAYFQYPMLRFDFIEVPPQFRQYDKGRKSAPGERLPTGAFSDSPQPPMQAMAMFIQKIRPNVPNFKWVGQQDLPDLAKVLHLDPQTEPAWRCHQDRLRPERKARGRGLLWCLLHLARGKRGRSTQA